MARLFAYRQLIVPINIEMKVYRYSKIQQLRDSLVLLHSQQANLYLCQKTEVFCFPLQSRGVWHLLHPPGWWSAVFWSSWLIQLQYGQMLPSPNLAIGQRAELTLGSVTFPVNYINCYGYGFMSDIKQKLAWGFCPLSSLSWMDKC